MGRAWRVILRPARDLKGTQNANQLYTRNYLVCAGSDLGLDRVAPRRVKEEEEQETDTYLCMYHTMTMTTLVV